MITRSAAGIWEISIPAPLPYSDSEQLIGYARYTEQRIEVRASHLESMTDKGHTIMPISEDPTIRAAMARALLWRMLSEIMTGVEGVGMPTPSRYLPKSSAQKPEVAVRLDTSSFSGGKEEEEEEDLSEEDDEALEWLGRGE